MYSPRELKLQSSFEATPSRDNCILMTLISWIDVGNPIAKIKDRSDEGEEGDNVSTNVENPKEQDITTLSSSWEIIHLSFFLCCAVTLEKLEGDSITARDYVL